MSQNSLEVAQEIVRQNKEIKSLTIIAHKVAVNWRQLHKDGKSKIQNISEALFSTKPLREKKLGRKKFLSLTLEDLDKLPEDEVWSLVSSVTCMDSNQKHIPMMNFHPIDITVDEIKVSIRTIMKCSGVILSTDRFFHYYGNLLMNENEWLKFMTNFLMPCVLVSPRYIGHSLNRGYCTLRLTTANIHKVKIPTVIDVI